MSVRLLFASLTYWAIKLSFVPVLRLSNYKKMAVGTCIIWAPKKQMEIITEGIDYLKAVDPELFQNLTSLRHYVICYNRTASYLRCREFFIITNNFIAWGKEGVALALAQFYMEPIEQFSSLDSNFNLTRRDIQKKVYQWIKDKSFPPAMKSQYKDVAEG